MNYLIKRDSKVEQGNFKLQCYATTNFAKEKGVKIYLFIKHTLLIFQIQIYRLTTLTITKIFLTKFEIVYFFRVKCKNATRNDRSGYQF